MRPHALQLGLISFLPYEANHKVLVLDVVGCLKTLDVNVFRNKIHAYEDVRRNQF